MENEQQPSQAPDLQNQQPVAEPKKNIKTPIVIVVILVFVIALGALGYWGYQQKQLKPLLLVDNQGNPVVVTTNPNINYPTQGDPIPTSTPGEITQYNNSFEAMQ